MQRGSCPIKFSECIFDEHFGEGCGTRHRVSLCALFRQSWFVLGATNEHSAQNNHVMIWWPCSDARGFFVVHIGCNTVIHLLTIKTAFDWVVDIEFLDLFYHNGISVIEVASL